VHATPAIRDSVQSETIAVVYAKRLAGREARRALLLAGKGNQARLSVLVKPATSSAPIEALPSTADAAVIARLGWPSMKGAAPDWSMSWVGETGS
jgi:hypothetical protein